MAPNDYVVRFVLGRRDWLQVEWPLAIFWLGAGFLLLAGIVWLTLRHWWAFLLLIPWLFFVGTRAIRVAVFLVRGAQTTQLTIRADGTVFVAMNESQPLFAYWRGFVNCGSAFLLWGADGQYRVLIPRRDISSADNEAIRERTGVDLLGLGPNEERLFGIRSKDAGAL